MTISGVSRSVGRPAVSGHRRRCPDTAGLPTDRETPEIVIAGAASSVVYSGHQSRHRGPVRSTAQHTGPGFGIAHTRLRPWVTGGTAASPQSSSCSSPPFPWSRRSFSTGWPVTGRTARCISALRSSRATRDGSPVRSCPRLCSRGPSPSLRGARRRGLVHRWAVARYAGRDPVGAGGQRLPPRPGGRRPGRRRAGSRRTTEARHGRSPTPGLAAQRPDGRAHCASMCRYARPVSGFLVAVDYGTLNTVAVLRRPDGQVRPLLFDGSPLLPSAVCLGPDGRLLVGRDAENAARLDPAALVLDPRSHIDAGTMAVGRASFPVAEVIAATLTRVAREAIQHAGGVLPRLALTHPAAWDERRQATLTEAGFRSGLGVATLVPRPVAAASYHTASSGDIGLGRCLLVYDLGAGSFEASLLRRSADGYDILAAKALDDFGGLDLDSLLIETIERAMAPSPPEAWRRLVAPTTAAERRQFTQLCADVRSAKEALSRQLAVGLHIPLVEQDVR